MRDYIKVTYNYQNICFASKTVTIDSKKIPIYCWGY